MIVAQYIGVELRIGSWRPKRSKGRRRRQTQIEPRNGQSGLYIQILSNSSLIPIPIRPPLFAFCALRILRSFAVLLTNVHARSSSASVSSASNPESESASESSSDDDSASESSSSGSDSYGSRSRSRERDDKRRRPRARSISRDSSRGRDRSRSLAR